MGIRIQPQQFQVREDDPFANDTLVWCLTNTLMKLRGAFWLSARRDDL